MGFSFILVRPQMGENIGAAARVMKNFGFCDLRVVSPRDGWPNPKAESMAAGGLDVLQGAKLFDTTSAAIADLNYVYATSARPRDMEKLSISSHTLAAHVRGGDAVTIASRSTTPTASNTASSELIRKEPPQEGLSAQAAQEARPYQEPAKQTQKTGILFGPERTGLENADIALADCITYVPVNPDYPSLNLAQTVALMAYECSKTSTNKYSQGHHPEHQAAPTKPTQILASKQELFGMFGHLEAELDKRNFWKVDAKKQQMWINIRNLFTRAELTDQETRTLRGIIRCLSER